MSTETTKARIKIDNGTNFGRVYTDKIVDTKISALQTAIDGKALKQTTGGITIVSKEQASDELLKLTSEYTYDSNGVLQQKAPIYYIYPSSVVNNKINAVKSTADTANATANSASSTANAAKATADTAKSTADACVKTVNIVSSQSPAGYNFNLVSADGKTTVGSILFDASLRPTTSTDNPHTLKVSCPYTITFED